MPRVASIEMRPCLSSADRYQLMVSSSFPFESWKGSKNPPSALDGMPARSSTPICRLVKSFRRQQNEVMCVRYCTIHVKILDSFKVPQHWADVWASWKSEQTSTAFWVPAADGCTCWGWDECAGACYSSKNDGSSEHISRDCGDVTFKSLIGVCWQLTATLYRCIISCHCTLPMLNPFANLVPSLLQ